MKKVFTLLFSLSLLMTVQTVVAQRASPKSTVMQDIGNTKMEIVYSRPSVDGRDVNKLVRDRANGEVWRTGADSNSLISFSTDVTVGGQNLKAGKYSLYSIPGDGEWTIIFNSITDQWGTKYDKNADVLRIKAKATTGNTEVETFTIGMTDFDKKAKDNANIELAWGDVSVKFAVKVNN